MRLLFLWHRWFGIGLCIFMALWFISGIVMLYIGYPKLTPTEHLNALPELSITSNYIDVDIAQRNTGQSIEPKSITLSSIAGAPFYLFKYPNLPSIAINALSGERVEKINEQQALNSARAFYNQPDARYLGLIDKDAWTQSTGLDDERPFHVVKINDKAQRLLYISSHNGQIVRDATFNERSWGWVGAWLHWIYPLRSMPWWADLIIYLSLIATLMSMLGQFLGIKRWRFKAQYKSGSHSPYRKGFARWHHIFGLLFGFILIAWVFSGLMSMRPWDILKSRSQLPVEQFQNGRLSNINSPLPTQELLTKLNDSGFHPRELSWHKVDGQFWLTAYNSEGHTRIIPLFGSAEISTEMPLNTILSGLKNIAPLSTMQYEWIRKYDFYYFSRETQSMYGSRTRPLPILRVKFSDPAETWLHVDPASGTILDNKDQRQRIDRWLFNLLHSWDWQLLLERPLLRELLMIIFSLGGLTISISGIVLGWRRVQRKIRTAV
ncbi:MAG TPA: PepSY domain-containing protein [Methylophaga sp.]|nr:PepSY domain-containing protein [Methylophaga sp.]